jgi:adenylate cyclase class 2
MHTEIEAKFLDVDHSVMRAKLQECGAELVYPVRLMRRKNYNLPNGDTRAWVRIRDEDGRITVSYKQLDDRSLHGTKEINLTVDDFGQAEAFMEAVGLVSSSEQYTKRESWKMDSVEIELDEWPWVKPFLEIEGPDEQAVRDAATKLGLEWDAAVHGSVEIAYRAEYEVTDEDINGMPVIDFGPVPEWLEAKRKVRT